MERRLAIKTPIVLEIAIPEYRPGERPDALMIGPKLDKLLEKNFPSKRIVIRCIGSQDHPHKSLGELAGVVLETGTDKYDKDRAGLGYDVGVKLGKHIDFFGTHVEVTAHTDIFTLELLDDFYHGALGDRKQTIRIDLVIIYDANKLKAVEHLYGENVEETDGFVFTEPEDKKDALLGIIKIS